MYIAIDQTIDKMNHEMIIMYIRTCMHVGLAM